MVYKIFSLSGDNNGNSSKYHINDRMILYHDFSGDSSTNITYDNIDDSINEC